MAENYYNNNTGAMENTSLSYTSLLSNLSSYVTSMDDYTRWKDFFEGSEGQIILELIASKSSYEAYKILTSRQETYLQYCTKLASAKAIAQNYSYSAYRGTNRQLTLQIDNPTSTVVIPALTVVGSAGDYDFVTSEQVVLNKGTSAAVKGYIGNLNTEQLTATSSDLLTFRFSSTNISEIFQLYLNSTQVPTTSIMKEMLDDKYFVCSNGVDGVDILYLNTKSGFTNTYSSGNTLTLKFIEYVNASYSESSLTFDYGDISSIASDIAPTDPESLKSVQINAPLFNATQKNIVARDDFKDIFKTQDSRFLDTNGIDYSNAIVQITYSINNSILLSTTEETAIKNNLSSYRAFGIPMCLISHPKRLALPLDIQITAKSTTTTLSDITKIVRDILSKYEYALATTISLSDIEADLNSNSAIKSARVYLSSTTWSSGMKVRLGTTIKPSSGGDYLYIANSFATYTGSSAPAWPDSANTLVADGDLIWLSQSIEGVPTQWTANTAKNMFAIVQQPMAVIDSTIVPNSLQFQVVNLNYLSGSTEPLWTNSDYATTDDANLIWLTVPKNATASQWSAAALYNKGDIVNATSTTDYSYQCIGYLKTLTSTEPSWSSSHTEFTAQKINFSVVKVLGQSLALSWDTYPVFEEVVTLNS